MTPLTAEEKVLLAEKAKAIRVSIVKSVTGAKSGHPGGSLSIADLMALLSFKEMDIVPKDPQMDVRDRLVLAMLHAAPALYSALAEKDYFPKDELNHLRKIDHMLQGHPAVSYTNLKLPTI